MLWVFAVALAIELPLLAFHLTVLFCVTRCVLKKEHFAQGDFFKVFIMKSLVDYIAYAFVSKLSPGSLKSGQIHRLRDPLGQRILPSPSRGCVLRVYERRAPDGRTIPYVLLSVLFNSGRHDDIGNKIHGNRPSSHSSVGTYSALFSRHTWPGGHSFHKKRLIR